MIKKMWWWLKVLFFPHLDRRAAARPKKMKHADDMLATAIIHLSDVIERKNK